MLRTRIYSHAHQDTGYGRAARDMLTALDRAKGMELEFRQVGAPGARDDIPGRLHRPIETPDVVIVHTLPGDCSRVLELEGLLQGEGPKLVAYTTWEALTMPDVIADSLLENFDQVWVPSKATQAAFAPLPGAGPRLAKTTRVIPHCYDEHAGFPAILPRESMGISPTSPDPSRFRFYWVGAWTARKNPMGLMRAFALAFGPDDHVELIMHSPGCTTDMFIAALAQTGLEQAQLPAITLSNRFMDATALASLHRNVDCFVTAARGEAWNLPAFDAMLAGRHVISQYGLGSDEYLARTTAELTDGWEAPAHVDVELTSWAACARRAPRACRRGRCGSSRT